MKTVQKPLPFNQDLNGYERVRRPLARKLWSWGIPVYIDMGRGLQKLNRNRFINIPQDAGGFDTACEMACPGSTAKKHRCTYFVRYGRVILHFLFSDGSNPFVKFCDSHLEAVYELMAWARTYDIMTTTSSDQAVSAYNLKAKQAVPPDLFRKK